MKHCLFCCLLFLTASVFAAEPKFNLPPTSWHGFDRYDFVITLETQSIIPLKPFPTEGEGFTGSEEGTRRCILVVPKTFAPDKPWSWRGCYWNHEPQTEIELLKRGFCIAYISTSRPDKAWETWYDFLTKQHGLSPKPAFIGMSRGGEFAYRWGTEHSECISCIYADNPGGNTDIFSQLHRLAQNDVPLLHVNGSLDPLQPRVSQVIETMYHNYGGRISIVTKEGAGHHPHSLRDPKFIANFIEKSVKEKQEPVKPLPAFVRTPAANTRRAGAGNPTKPMAFYAIETVTQTLPNQPEPVICRGAEFSDVYDKYEFSLPGVEGIITVIVPNKPAEGTPWIYRADAVERNDAVSLSLLEKGLHIVTGPVPYNADGPKLEHWNRVYDYLVQSGFSAKPILSGKGAAAMSAYAWAIANSDNVSVIYADHPIVQRSTMCAKPIKDSLQPLIEAKVPAITLLITRLSDESEKEKAKLLDGTVFTTFPSETVELLLECHLQSK